MDDFLPLTSGNLALAKSFEQFRPRGGQARPSTSRRESLRRRGGVGKFRASGPIRVQSGAAPAGWEPWRRGGRARGPAGREVRGPGCSGFHGGFQELAAIGGEQGGGIVVPRVPRASRRMNTSRKACNSPRRAGWKVISPLKNKSSCPANGLFGRRAPLATVLIKPCVFGEPMHDQAGVGEPGEADERGWCGMHAQVLANPAAKAMQFLALEIPQLPQYCSFKHGAKIFLTADEPR